jgi:chromosome segregation ATPase
VLKQINTAERVAGFLKDGRFHVTHVFASHDDYEHKLGNYSKKDFINNVFIEWEETDDMGADTDSMDEMQAERDRLLLEKNNLKTDLRNSEEKIEELELENLGLSEKISELEELKKVIDEKEMGLTQLREELDRIKEAAESSKKRTGFLGKLLLLSESILRRKKP